MNLSPTLPLFPRPAWADAAPVWPRLLRPVPRRARPLPAAPQAEDGSAELDRAFMRCGGLARADELLALVRPHCEQPISRVARWIVGRELVQYRSGVDTVFPLFQFDPVDLSIRPAVSRVVAELAAVMDSQDLAGWFIRPNSALNGRAPLDALGGKPDAVVDTARADRFIAKG